MFRMIISLVISLILVMSPAIGQFINQQTTLLRQSPYAAEIEGMDDADTFPYKFASNAESIASADFNSSTSAAEDTVLPKATQKTNAAATLDVKSETKPETTPMLKSVIKASPEPEVKLAVKAAAGPESKQATKETEALKDKPSSNPTVRPAVRSTEKSVAKSTVKPTEAPRSKSTATTQAPKPKSTAKVTTPQNTPQAKAATEDPKTSSTEKKASSSSETATKSAEATPKPTDPPKAPASSSSPSKESSPVSTDKVFDTSKVNSGIIGIRYNNTSGKRVKLMVEKGSSRYTYNLNGDGSLETFPLQSGNGEYKISIMENTEGQKYKYILSETVKIKSDNESSAYLGSIQMINWNSSMSAIKKAERLTAGVSGDEAKLNKIYSYVVKNIRYDRNKLGSLPSTYIPNINDIYSSKSGICYDFASLTAGMLRSVGIPAKLIMGYAEGINGYHAWNEVLIGGKWITIDTSCDSQMHEAGAAYSMKKKKSNYQTDKTY